MQRAEVVLSLLSRKTRHDESFVFQRLYRNLFNPDFYLNAYHRIHGKPGHHTAGTESNIHDGLKQAMVDAIIEKMKAETYHPKPVSIQSIPKKMGKQRPLGLPTFADQLVQEVLRQMLEAIYEPRFLDTSHGFRPRRNRHTALHGIKTSCRGTDWVIKGNIKSLFDNMDYDKLLELLSGKIDDGRLLELIKRFLKAGCLNFRQGHNSISGSPHGGIISPLLANIYLHELDKFMERLSTRYTPSADPMDTYDIRVRYTRYVDDFVVCITGPKKLVQSIWEDIRSFLKNRLNLDLNLQESLITNLSDKRVRFLGYEITKSMSRNSKNTIQLLVPGDVIREWIRPFSTNGKPIHHKTRIHLPLPDLISRYNVEIRELYNYYSLATDVSSKLGKFRYYHYYSLVKTIARKERSSVKKVLNKYGIDVKRKHGTGTGKLLGVMIQCKDGEKRALTYFNEPLKKKD